MAEQLQDYIGTGQALWSFPDKDELAFKALNQELNFLTAKPVIYAANVDEDKQRCCRTTLS